jgi:rhodanese-related sulfurtransferase
MSTLFGATAQNDDTVKILTAPEFKEAINLRDVQLVDVRTAQEFSDGAIKNAINIDFYEQETFNAEFNKLDKEKPLYIYCRSGSRSHQSAVKLIKMGFKEIYDLQGGYLNWK